MINKKSKGPLKKSSRISAPSKSMGKRGNIGKPLKIPKTSGNKSISSVAPRGKNNNLSSKKALWFTIGIRALLVFLIVGIIGVISVIIYLASLSSSLPNWDANNFLGEGSSTLYDMNGERIGDAYTGDAGNRKMVNYEDINPMYFKGLIATEDQRFYKHHGIDYIGLSRAVIRNIFTNSPDHGASTLTQQLAKNVLLKKEERQGAGRTIKTKAKEAILAKQIEKTMTKEDILINYANLVFFGNNQYGVEAASQYYFGKSADEISDAEALLLAGISQNALTKNPKQHPEAAKIRRDFVIQRTLDEGFITEKEAKELTKTEITLVDKTTTSEGSIRDFGYFTDYATKEADAIVQSLKLPSIYTDEYKIYTTMDKTIQSSMEVTFADSSLFPAPMNGVDAEAAMVVINNKTGAVAALMGGRTYNVAMGLNRAVDSKRQPGSTFKPLTVYGPSFESGLIGPSSLFRDTDNPPIIDKNTGQVYAVSNSKGTNYPGNITVRNAVSDSINRIAVRIIEVNTPQKGFDFATRMGITSLNPKDKSNLSLALGTSEVAPIEMAIAFSTLANGGIKTSTHSVVKIEDSDGKVIYDAPTTTSVATTPQTAYITTNVLEGVVSSGTGKKADVDGFDIAGKTGTSNLADADGNVYKGNRDVWFVGYSPDYTGAVWVGYDKTSFNNPDPTQDHYLTDSYSSGNAANIWGKVLRGPLNALPSPTKRFKKPAGITTLKVSPATGLPDGTGSKSDIFIEGLLPTYVSDTLDYASTFEEGKSDPNITVFSGVDNGTAVTLSWPITPPKDPKYPVEYSIYKVVNKKEQIVGTSKSNVVIDKAPRTSYPITYYIVDSLKNKTKITVSAPATAAPVTP